MRGAWCVMRPCARIIQPCSNFTHHESRATHSSKLDRFVQLPALGTAGAIHIRIIRVNVTAFRAAINRILAGRGFESPLTQLCVNHNSRQRTERGEKISQDESRNGHFKAASRKYSSAATAAIQKSLCRASGPVPAGCRDPVPWVQWI